MADINRLPNEVLISIFHHYLQTENQLSFLNCLPNVCRKWMDVCKDSSFFETIDGSLPIDVIEQLAESKSLRRTKSFKFCKIEKCKKGRIKKIYANMPQLRSLNLTKVCHNFIKTKKHSVFTELEGLCPDLCKLVLSDPKERCQVVLSAYLFKNFIRIRGPQLVTLDFSYIKWPYMRKLFALIADNCPNLEEFLAQNLIDESRSSLFFPIHAMQKGCQKLKTLRLGEPIIYSQKSCKDAIGFPYLETFTHASRQDYAFSPSHLESLVGKSPRLKILDVRGCVMLWYEDVDLLPAVDLEQIHLSYTNLVRDRLAAKLFQKWSHSLNLVNVSHVKGDAINEIFEPELFPNGLPNLEILDVNATTITADTVKSVIHLSPKLRFLNLESCRNLKRGTKHIYRSRAEIEEFLLKCVLPD